MPAMSAVLLLAALVVTPPLLDRIEVRGRRPQPRAAEAVTVLDGDDIAAQGPTHPSELAARLPGAWISRGSGQEQLTAIRSPVLTGPGACGAFLWLEDGIPIRPAGLCNLNQLFEVDHGQLEALELMRGPGSAVHGSNALHGVLDVRSRAPGDSLRRWLAFDAGGDDYRRVRAAFGHVEEQVAGRAEFSAVKSGSFRFDEDFRHEHARLGAQWRQAPGAPRLQLALARLRQNTAGFVTGRDSYRDARRRSNANPEAFRNGDALRLWGHWQFDRGDAGQWSLRPYVRRDSQRFLQHFIPGQPLEENGSRSAGLQLHWHRAMLDAGLDLEWARGDLLELQAHPLASGSLLQREIRPAGRHYDYRVAVVQTALFAQHGRTLGGGWRLQSGLRLEGLRYRYDTRMAAGNGREDGSACGFGGCLFNRPADRSDRFGDWNAQLGLLRSLAGGEGFARLARAFRFPQAAELYRLQRGQDVADLDSERLDGVELGWRLSRPEGSIELSGYAYRKRRVILRDTAGFNLADGRTTHHGIEVEFTRALAGAWRLQGNLAWGRHRYAFDRSLAGGERVRRGNDVDTAPRWLGGLRLRRDSPRVGAFELEWLHQGGYFLDAANTARYPGHDLLNLRWQRPLDRHWELSLRLMNLGDRRYAERADLAFGDFRYFPGAGRNLFLGLDWRP